MSSTNKQKQGGGSMSLNVPSSPAATTLSLSVPENQALTVTPPTPSTTGDPQKGPEDGSEVKKSPPPLKRQVSGLWKKATMKSLNSMKAAKTFVKHGTLRREKGGSRHLLLDRQWLWSKREDFKKVFTPKLSATPRQQAGGGGQHGIDLETFIDGTLKICRRYPEFAEDPIPIDVLEELFDWLDVKWEGLVTFTAFTDFLFLDNGILGAEDATKLKVLDKYIAVGQADMWKQAYHRRSATKVILVAPLQCFFTLSKDSTVRKWDSCTLEHQTVYKHPNTEEWLTDMIYMDDLQQLAVSSFAQSVYVINAKRMVLFKECKLSGSEYPMCLAYHEKTLFVGTKGGAVVALSYEARSFGGDFRQIWKVNPHKSHVKTMLAVAGLGSIYSGSLDGDVSIIPIAHPQGVRVLKAHERGINSIKYVPRSQHFVSGGFDAVLSMWDTSFNLIKEFAGHTKPIIDIRVGNEELLHVFSLSEDKEIRLWDLKSYNCIYKVSLNIMGRGNETILSFEYNHPEKRLIAVGKSLIPLEVDSRFKPESGHKQLVMGLLFDENYDRIVSADEDKIVCTWNLKTGQQEYRCHAHDKVAGIQLASVAITSRRLICAFADGLIRMWTHNNSYLQKTFTITHDPTELLSVIQFDYTPTLDHSSKQQLRKQGTMSLTNEDEEQKKTIHYIAGVSEKLNSISVWDAANPNIPIALTGTRGVTSLGYGGGQLAAGHAGGIHLWEVETWKLQQMSSSRHQDADIEKILFILDPFDFIVTYGSSSVVTFWSLTHHCIVHQMDTHHVAFLKAMCCGKACGDFLVTGDEVGYVKVWDLSQMTVRSKEIDPALIYCSKSFKACEEVTQLDFIEKYAVIVVASPTAMTIWKMNGELVGELGSKAWNSEIMTNCKGTLEGGDGDDELFHLHVRPTATTSNHRYIRYMDELDGAEDAGDNQWRTVRVFISSTFLDMHAERDLLVLQIFPEIREILAKYKLHVVEVDLRWGVTSDDTENALEICLTEIDRCRPFFINMLGERYGWIPPAYTVPDDPKFDWVRKYEPGHSVTDLEIYHAYVVDNNPYASFYFRDPAFIQDLPLDIRKNFDSEDPERHVKIRDLKDFLRQRRAKITNYTPTFAGEFSEVGIPKLDGLVDTFGVAVKKNLIRSIEKYYKLKTNSRTVTQTEDQLQDYFAETRSRFFIGRQRLMVEMTSKLDNIVSGYLVLVGRPGSGKSALLAKFSKHYAKTNKFVTIFTHFIGATASSASVHWLLNRLCRFIKSNCHLPELSIPPGFWELKNAIPNILEQASLGNDFVVILDALNQLEETFRAHTLHWLPRLLPRGVKCVVSTLDGPIAEIFESYPMTSFLEVSPLNDNEKTMIIENFLGQFRKQLDEVEIDLLIRKQQSDHPLYLIVACEELRVFGQFFLLKEKIRALPEQISGLIDNSLERLEQWHGNELVGGCLSLLYASRIGLLESELLMIMRERMKKKFVMAHWFQLYRNMELFLKPRDESGHGYLCFFHQQFGFAVGRRFFKQRHLLPKVHQVLAGFFSGYADPPITDQSKEVNSGGFCVPRNDKVVDAQRPQMWQGTSRALSEVAFHICRGGLWAEYTRVLTDLNYIRAKFLLGMIYNLLEDYVWVSSAEVDLENILPSQLHVVEETKFFIQRNSHILLRNPDMIFQLANNQPNGMSPARSAFGDVKKGRWSGTYFEWENKPSQKEPCLKTLIGHLDRIWDCQILSQKNSLVTASLDHTLKIWDLRSGEEKATLKGHTSGVMACEEDPKSKRICSGGLDKLVKVWDGISGGEEMSFRGHLSGVYSICFSASGKMVASGSSDKMIKVWNVHDKVEMLTLKGHTGAVNSLKFSPTKEYQLLSCSNDRTVREWSVKMGVCVRVFRGHKDRVWMICFSPDGKLAASAGQDKVVMLWDLSKDSRSRSSSLMSSGTAPTDLEGSSSSLFDLIQAQKNAQASDGEEDEPKRQEGKLLRTLRGHSDGVRAVSFSSDGIYLVTGAEDKSIKVWNVRNTSTRAVATFSGHDQPVLACGFCPNPSSDIVNSDVYYLYSCSCDKSLKVWEFDAATDAPTYGHTDEVRSCMLVDRNDMKQGFGITGSSDGSIGVWSTKSAKEIKRILPAPGLPEFQRIGSTALNDKANAIVATSLDHSDLIFIDATTFTHTDTLDSGHDDAIPTVAISSPGEGAANLTTWMATGSLDKVIKVWTFQEDKLRYRISLRGHSDGVLRCIFSPVNSELLVSASMDCAIRAWDVHRGKCLGHLYGHQQSVNCAAFGRTGKILLSGSDDFSLRLWDLRLSRCVTTTTGHMDSIRDCSLMGGDTYMVSASNDKTLRVWDIRKSGQEIVRFQTHLAASFCSIDVSRENDSRLLCGDAAGHFYLLNLANVQRQVTQVAGDIADVPSAEEANQNVSRRRFVGGGSVIGADATSNPNRQLSMASIYSMNLLAKRRQQSHSPLPRSPSPVDIAGRPSFARVAELIRRPSTAGGGALSGRSSVASPESSRPDSSDGVRGFSATAAAISMRAKSAEPSTQPSGRVSNIRRSIDAVRLVAERNHSEDARASRSSPLRKQPSTQALSPASSPSKPALRKKGSSRHGFGALLSSSAPPRRAPALSPNLPPL